MHDSAAKDLRQVYFLDVIVQSGDTSLEVCNPCYMSVVTVKRDSTSLVSTQMLALAACEYFLQHVLPVLPVSVCEKVLNKLWRAAEQATACPWRQQLYDLAGRASTSAAATMDTDVDFLQAWQAFIKDSHGGVRWRKS